MNQIAWIPAEDQIQNTRLYLFMKRLGFHQYDAFYQQSVQDIAWFWGEVDREMGLEWNEPYTEVLDQSGGVAYARWFVDGKCNLTVNCLDRFVKDPVSCDRLAMIWEGDDGTAKKYTYLDLWNEVNRCAAGLRKLGVQPGDRIAIYLPMIAENVVAMLAIARIGAIFTPCFSGFGGEAVAIRMKDCGAKIFITADGFYRRGKVVRLKEEADRAANLIPSIQRMIVVERVGEECSWNPERDMKWSELVTDMQEVEVYSADSDEPFMIIYTSGTTGIPKGTVHTHTGFPIKAGFDAGFGMDVGPGDILFWVTDMGWMMGPWMVFGALMNGSTMLVYEGTPDYPSPARLWEVVARYGVTHLGISPTLIRSLMKHGEQWLNQHDISTLRIFGSTGEPWNPDPWWWLFEKVGKKKVPIFNYSGGTETSGGILGNNPLTPIIPCGFSGPLPGMDADIVDEKGVTSARGEVGELVLRQPWVGMTKSFWENDGRYLDSYWRKWKDTWVHGDWVRRDEQGNWFITGRSDDTLKIAGKRLGPAEMESVLVSHPWVSEAATIGVPDEEKGESAVCFVVLKPERERGEREIQELIAYVADHLGKPLKPRMIFAVSDLPRTRNGKILRRMIRSAFLNDDIGDISALDNPLAIEEIRKTSTYEKASGFQKG